MKTTNAIVVGVVAGVGLTFGLAILAGRDAQRQREALSRADIEREARAFLERCRGDGPVPDNFEDIVQREVALTMRQRQRTALEG
jgi:hypothetical protein